MVGGPEMRFSIVQQQAKTSPGPSQQHELLCRVRPPGHDHSPPADACWRQPVKMANHDHGPIVHAWPCRGVVSPLDQRVHSAVSIVASCKECAGVSKGPFVRCSSPFPVNTIHSNRGSGLAHNLDECSGILGSSPAEKQSLRDRLH